MQNATPAVESVAAQPVCTGSGLCGGAGIGVRVFLEDPAVSAETNHLERNLRAIPTGRRNWMFAWPELGARPIGMIQSLLVTCKLQGVDPYPYLVDVLQRVDQHPAKRAIKLIPRAWKTLFADRPLRSDLDRSRDPPPH